MSLPEAMFLGPNARVVTLPKEFSLSREDLLVRQLEYEHSRLLRHTAYSIALEIELRTLWSRRRLKWLAASARARSLHQHRT